MLLERDATSVAKTNHYARLCHKTSKKISKIEYQSDFENHIQFDAIDTSGWDGYGSVFPLTLYVNTLCKHFNSSNW